MFILEMTQIFSSFLSIGAQFPTNVCFLQIFLSLLSVDAHFYTDICFMSRFLIVAGTLGFHF